MSDTIMDAQRLKVLFVTNWYPSREEPLKALWAREHAKSVRLYDDVLVLHCVGPEAKLRELWRVEAESDDKLLEGIPTRRMRYRHSPIPRVTYFIYLWSIFQVFKQIVRQGFRPDIIHVHVYDAGAPAVFIAKLNRIPIVVAEHFSTFPRRLLGPLDVAKAWLAFRWADRVLPVSHALQDAIERYGLRARFEVIPNIADTGLFFPSTEERSDSHIKQIVFVGQLTPVKGIPFLLNAAALLRCKRDDWHLDIVGNGKERMAYERQAADLKLGDLVTFQGSRSRAEVAQFMRQADLFVLPSLVETFSAPAAEALACGTPVLSTRCGGPEEFIVADVGFLVASGDATALFQGLDHMLNNLHLYSRRWISQYARDRFSPEAVGARLHALYQSLTESS